MSGRLSLSPSLFCCARVCVRACMCVCVSIKMVCSTLTSPCRVVSIRRSVPPSSRFREHHLWFQKCIFLERFRRYPDTTLCCCTSGPLSSFVDAVAFAPRGCWWLSIGGSVACIFASAAASLSISRPLSPSPPLCPHSVPSTLLIRCAFVFFISSKETFNTNHIQKCH